MLRVIKTFVIAVVLCGTPTGATAKSPDFEKWADATFGAAVARHAATAATVSVVRDGKIILSKTYGMADAKRKKAIHPNRDRFLIASVTKTFTATAVAQLISQGKITSLNDPANKYLKRIQLPKAFGKDVTIRELLTHSAGFEERGWGIGKPDSIPTPVPGAYILDRLPAIVRAPGARIVYANIDPPLLGVLIEDITGLTLRDYLQKYLLDPLEMRDTELMYDPLAPRMVKAYSLGAGGALGRAPHDINVPFYAPTGSIHTTANDMAKYMAGQLGARPEVLPFAVLRLLHTPLKRNAKGLDELGMFFFISEWNGETTVEHGGVFSGFQSELILIPGRRTGIFYSWAGSPEDGNKALPLEFAKISADVYRLAIGPHVDPTPIAQQPDLTPFLGRYWRERRQHTTPEILLSLQDVVEVALHPDHGLTIGGDGPYYAIGPASFARSSRVGVPGKVYSFADNEILEASNYGKRVAGLSDPQNVLTIAYLGFGVLLSGLLALFCWRKGLHRVLGAAAAGIAIGLPVTILAPAGSMLDFVTDVIHGVAWRFTGLRVLAVATVVLTASLTVAIWRMRRFEPEWRARFEQIHLVLLWIAAVALIFVFAFLNLF